MLARFLPTILRAMTSGRLGTVAVSPMVTIQPGPSASRLTRRGRSSLMRTIASPSAPRSSAALRIAWLASACERGKIDLGGAVEHQPQHVGALEHGGRRLDREREFGAQSVAGLAAARRRPARPDWAPAACVRPWRISQAVAATRARPASAPSLPARPVALRLSARRRRGSGSNGRRGRCRLARRRHRPPAAAPPRHPWRARSRAARSPARQRAQRRPACRLGALAPPPPWAWRRRGRHRPRCCGPRGRCAPAACR